MFHCPPWVRVSNQWFLTTFLTWFTFCSLVGSLNKIPLSVAGIVLFHVPTSLQNSTSILFGKLLLQLAPTTEKPFQNFEHNLCLCFALFRTFGWGVLCSSKVEGKIPVWIVGLPFPGICSQGKSSGSQVSGLLFDFSLSPGLLIQQSFRERGGNDAYSFVQRQRDFPDRGLDFAVLDEGSFLCSYLYIFSLA